MAGWFDKKERGGEGKKRFKLQKGYKYVIRIMGDFVKFRLHQSEWGVQPGWSDVCAMKEHGACPRCADGNNAKERFCFPIIILQQKPPEGEWAVVNNPTIWAMAGKRVRLVFELADDYEGREDELLGKGGAWKPDVLVTCPDDADSAEKQEFSVRFTGKKSLLTSESIEAYKANKPDLAAFTKSRSPDDMRKSMSGNTDFDTKKLDAENEDALGVEPEEERPAKKSAGKKKAAAPAEDIEGGGDDDAELTDMLAGLDDL